MYTVQYVWMCIQNLNKRIKFSHISNLWNLWMATKQTETTFSFWLKKSRQTRKLESNREYCGIILKWVKKASLDSTPFQLTARVFSNSVEELYSNTQPFLKPLPMNRASLYLDLNINLLPAVKPRLKAVHPLGYACAVLSQSTKLTKGPSSYFSTFVYRGSSHRRKRALHVLNLIWFGWIALLYQWSNFLVQMISTCLPSRRGSGGRSAPCGFHIEQFILIHESSETANYLSRIPTSQCLGLVLSSSGFWALLYVQKDSKNIGLT